MLNYLYLYLLTVPVFLAIDFIWLGYVASGLYQRELAGLLGPVNYPVAGLFYLIYVIGVLIFAVIPALSTGDLTRAIILGALFGFFAYATYDLTNLSTLRDWPFMLSLIDMLWGTVLTGSVAGASYLIGRWLGM